MSTSNMSDADSTAQQIVDDTSEPLRDLVHDLADRVDQLERENQELRDRIDEKERSLELVQETVWDLEDVVTDDRSIGQIASQIDNHDYQEKPVYSQLQEVDSTLDDLDGIRADLDDAQDQYNRRAAMLQKRFTAIEEEIGLDTLDKVTEDDKISRLIKNGAEDVIPNVHKVHRRARKVLVNADDWGERIDDQRGPAVSFNSPQLKPYLKTEYDKPFSTTEVKRIFDQIERLAQDSNRPVQRGTDPEGRHSLKVWGI